jgi:hypothetical protein
MSRPKCWALLVRISGQHKEGYDVRIGLIFIPPIIFSRYLRQDAQKVSIG